MKTFKELEHDACLWPAADCGLPGERGEFLFCGEPAARDGCPYCREHMALAYKPRRAMKPPVARLGAHESARQELVAIAAVAC